MDSNAAGARLAVLGPRLHAFVPGDRLRHLVAGAAAGSWIEDHPVSDEEVFPGAFAVLGGQSAIVVAYVVWASPGGESTSAERTATLKVAEIRAGGNVIPRDVAQFRQRDWFEVCGPRLVRLRGELHVVLGVSPIDTLRQRPRSLNYGRFVVGGDTTWIVQNNRLLDVHQASPGGAWFPPVDIVPPWQGWASQALAVAATDERMFVFSIEDGLQGVESTDGRHWSDPMQVTEAHGITDARGLAASASGDAVVVTWVDTRLGMGQYFPVMGYNRQAHSDVFALRSTVRFPSLASLAHDTVLRVTPKSEYVGAVAACSATGRHAIAWFSHGRNSRSSPQRPEVGVAHVPANGSR